MEGKLSPYDWHEGSSIISVDAAEERMLSTSFITGLLSSAASFRSPADSSPRSFHPPSQVDVGSLVSEMSYPPSSSRHREPVVGPSHFPPSSHPTPHPSTFPGRGVDSCTNGEDDTMTSFSHEGSHEGHADIIEPGLGCTKVSVLGMAPATLRHISSAISISDSLYPRTQATYGSNSPLNSHPPSVFSSAMNKTRPVDIQSPIAFPQTQTPERPMSPDFDAGKRSVRFQRRESAQSSRTVRSHVSSLISAAGQRTVRAARATMEWMRIKPLPPLPTIPTISIHEAQQHRRMEGSVPLPQLAERADRLNAMLVAGHLPHDSVHSSPKLDSDKDSRFGARVSRLKMTLGRRRRSVDVRDSQSECSRSPLKSKSFIKRPTSRNGKIKLFAWASALALLTLIAIVVGITVGHKHAHSPSCSAGRTGNTCNLGKLCAFFTCNSIGLPTNVDSTCVCTSSNTSQCNPLAQSLVSLIPFVNDQFDSKITPATVVNALSSSGVSALSSDCAAQARVVDVSPALDSQIVPNRTEWAQAALLWSFVLSQNASSVGNLRDFISKTHWSGLPRDGPVTGFSSKFSMTELGFIFDFAAQTISEPSVSFVTDGQPSSAQLAEVGSTALAALDRMYSFASGTYSPKKSESDDGVDLCPRTASSTLRTTAMTNYWQNVLGQDPSTFRTFASLLISSPILIPFVVHLRLPFKDSQTGPKQAVILSRAASSRVVVYNGEVLSGLPTSDTSSIPTTDPLQFGTLDNINHVLLNFFEAIPDINVATQLVDYVLSYPVIPPSNNTLLGQSLNTIPTLEVAVFGSVTPPDVMGVVSSFTTPSGSLFFGTDQSLAVRDWAMVAAQKGVTWTETAPSTKCGLPHIYIFIPPQTPS